MAATSIDRIDAVAVCTERASGAAPSGPLTSGTSARNRVRTPSMCGGKGARRTADVEILLLFPGLCGGGSIVGRVQRPRHFVLALQLTASGTERDVGS